jgi:hypothetical protein
MNNKRKTFATQSFPCPMCGDLVKFRMPHGHKLCERCKTVVKKEKETEKEKLR